MVCSQCTCISVTFTIQDFLIDLLRKSKQWFIRCILPQLPHRLPGALPSPDPTLQNQEESANESAARGHIDVPLVRDQLKRAELVKAARIYKQGTRLEGYCIASVLIVINTLACACHAYSGTQIFCMYV